MTTTSPEALLRAAVDAMLDPQALVEAVRDGHGRIVDFVFRELNPSACGYLQRSEPDVLGARLTEVFPELPTTGLLAQYTHAMETGEPLEIEAFPLFSKRYHAVRRFDLTATRADADWLSLVWRDVTDRHRAQRFAEIEFSDAARDLVRVSSDALLDPMVLLEAVRDADGQVVDFRYREVNQATCDYLDLSRVELIGHGLLEISPGVAQAGLFADYVRCLKTGEPVVYDDLTYDNEILADTRRYDLRATRATKSAITLTWRDVTERYLASQQTIAAQRNYRLIAENVDDMVCQVRDGRFAWVSPSVGGVLGGTPDYWLGRKVREIIPADDRPAFVHRRKILAEGRVLNQRIRLVALDGVTHWFHMHAKPFYDAEGNRDGHTTTLRLIDDEVAAEQALEAAHHEQSEADALYHRAIDNAAVGMCLVTPEGRLFDVNLAMRRMFGLESAQIDGKVWQDFTAPEFLEEETANFNAILEGRIDSYRMVKSYLHADGHRIWGDLSVSAIRDANGRVQNLLGLITDVTALSLIH
nr:PAS domain S-box protein [Mycobacterium sp.]